MSYKGRYRPNMYETKPVYTKHIITEVIETKKGGEYIQTRVEITENNNPNMGIDADAFNLTELIKTGNFIKPKGIEEDIMTMRERAEKAFNSAWEKIKINKFQNS